MVARGNQRQTKTNIEEYITVRKWIHYMSPLKLTPVWHFLPTTWIKAQIQARKWDRKWAHKLARKWTHHVSPPPTNTSMTLPTHHMDQSPKSKPISEPVSEPVSKPISEPVS